MDSWPTPSKHLLEAAGVSYRYDGLILRLRRSSVSGMADAVRSSDCLNVFELPVHYSAAAVSTHLADLRMDLHSDC